METILQNIRDWFLEKEKHFVTFAEADSRLEGWFKAELLVLLTRLRSNGIIKNFKREIKIESPSGRCQVDLGLSLVDGQHLCELKALCISRAAGTPRNLRFYFRDDNVGLIKDFKKLETLANKNKWVMGFVYPNPGHDRWIKEVASLPAEFKHWQCITDPSDFPSFLFISVWRS